MKYVCNDNALGRVLISKLAKILQVFMSEMSDPVSDPEKLFSTRIGTYSTRPKSSRTFRRQTFNSRPFDSGRFLGLQNFYFLSRVL
jgi:hypothetical protein